MQYLSQILCHRLGLSLIGHSLINPVIEAITKQGHIQILKDRIILNSNKEKVIVTKN